MNQAEIKLGDQLIKFPIRDAADQSVFEEIFTDRLYRRAENLLTEADLIIDVGAHVGFFSIYARHLNQSAKVIALEPNKDNFRALEYNFSISKMENYTTHNAAIVPESHATAKTKLYIAVDSHNHSTLPNERQASEYVVAKKLSALISDDLAKKIFVKIDIEGAEKLLYPEWTHESLGRISYIVLEYHNYGDKLSGKIENKLRECGFSCETFKSPFDARFGLIIARNKNVLV